MRPYYRSSSLPADLHDSVRQRLDGWLEAKGFGRLDEPVLFDDLDRDHERGIVMLWNDRWTILLHSEGREEERLRFELLALGAPVFQLWCQDTEGWGYSLHTRDGAVSAWESDGREVEDGDDDLAALASVLGCDLDPAALRRARRRSAGDNEAVAIAFATALGVPLAASGYPGPAEAEGFSIERWLYRRHEHEPMAGFELHAVQATATAAPPHANDWTALAEAIGVDEARRLRRLTVVARWLSGALRVLKTPWVLAHRAHLALRHRRRAASLRQAFESTSRHPGLHRLPENPELEIEPTALTNRRHGVRVRWSADADIAPADVSGVLPLRLGATPVVCRALRGGMATRMLTRRVGEIEADEDYTVGGFPAKRVRSRLPQVDPPLVLEEHYVQTPRAVYVFGVGPAVDLDDDLPARMRALVERFDVVDGDETESEETPGGAAAAC